MSASFGAYPTRYGHKVKCYAFLSVKQSSVLGRLLTWVFGHA